ncbi:MAG: hypothetical protein KatS3mg082_1287 [Nitrospiraceae bacterium]|nr:MAG: hypothetical protein KatS3mg082_1287 [Nitrospiraceae bacterium]
MTRPSMSHVLVSLLIGLAGWLAAQALTQLDRDLRILYTEYTLAAADLGHISGDLIRYRSTILRALEAPTAPEADRILASLPVQRDRVLRAIERYAAASRQAARGGPAAAAALQALRTSVAAYFADADETIRLIRRRWAAPRPEEAAAWQAQAERHASAQAGVTLIRVSVALDQVLDVVATVAGAMYEDGARTTRRSSLLLVGGSLVLIALVWFAPRIPRPVRPLSRETSSSAGDGVPAAVTPRSDDRCADSSTWATEESRYHKAPRVTGDPGA